jgi:hypothetical protein
MLEKLELLAEHCKILEDVEELFAPYGRIIKDLEKLGCIAVALDECRKYLVSTAHFRYKDILIIEEWGKLPDSNEVHDGLYRIVLSNSMYFFNKYYDTQGRLILVGILLKKVDELRLISVASHANQMLEDINRKLEYASG